MGGRAAAVVHTCHASSGVMPSCTIDLASSASDGADGRTPFAAAVEEEEEEEAASAGSWGPPMAARSSIAAPVASATSADRAAVGATCDPIGGGGGKGEGDGVRDHGSLSNCTWITLHGRVLLCHCE